MKPVLLTLEQVAEILADMQTGVSTGETDEGSISFSLPVMDDCLHEAELPTEPIERTKWEVVQDGDEAAPVMYEPKPGYVWVQASYRIGRTMGQGGLRTIGVL